MSNPADVSARPAITGAEDPTGYWINGRKTALVPATDRGLHFGDGLFETLPVLRGRIALLESHLERLHAGCKRLGIACVPQRQLAMELAQAADGQHRVLLKLIVTRGTGGYGFRPPPEPRGLRMLLRYDWPEEPRPWAKQGVHVRLCNTHLGHNPQLAGLKHLNRLEQVLAQSEWNAADDIQEGLMTDSEGSIIGGTTSNVFAWLSHGVLATPGLKLCGVAGIMRGYLLECAREAGIQLRVATLSLAELMRAEEIFLCNSLIGVWPVTHIGHWKYRIGEVTRRMQRWSAEILAGDAPTELPQPAQPQHDQA